MDEQQITAPTSQLNPPCQLYLNSKQSCQYDNIPITNSNIVYVKKNKLRLLLSHIDKICVFFGCKLIDSNNHDNFRNSDFLTYYVFCDNADTDLLIELTKRVQVCL